MALDKTFAVGEVLNAADVNGHLLGLWIPIDKRVTASGAAAASVSFASIDSNFRIFRLTASVTTATATEIALRINNDSGTNYSSNRLYSPGSGTVGLPATAVTLIDLGIGAMSHHVVSLIIAKYSTTTRAAVSGTYAAVDTPSTVYNVHHAAIWNNSSALINRIDIITHNGGANIFGVFALEGMRGV